MDSTELPNYTQIPNSFFDYWQPLLSLSAFSILMCLSRKIFGWHKTNDTISINQLMKCTGLSKHTAISGMDQLIQNGLVKKFQQTNEYGCMPNQYSLTLIKPDDALYQDDSKPQKKQVQSMQNLRGGTPKNLGGVVQNLDRGVVQNLHTQKKDITKERKKEIYKEKKPPTKSQPSDEGLRRERDLFLSIKKNDTHKSPLKNHDWADEIDKIHRIDKRPWEEIDLVIAYRESDEFWSTTCLSAKSLRKNFDKMLVRAKMTPKSIAETAPSNEELAKKAAEKFKSKENSCHCRIEPCHGYVEFTPIRGFSIPVQVKYDSKNFQSELQQNLVRNKFIKPKSEQS